jgi:DNA-binding CsgD family transcriptional regulator
MRIIHLSSSEPVHRGSSPARLLDAVAAVTASVGHNRFPAEALAELNKLLPLCWWSAYSLHDSAPPRYHGGATYKVRDNTAQAFRHYVAGLYAQDRTFEDARQCLQPGDVALTHWCATEMPVRHRESIYTSNNLRERVSVIRRTRSDTLLSLNLYRHVGQQRFKDSEIELMRDASRSLLACMELHLQWPQQRGEVEGTAETAAEDRSSAWLDGLPRREREVCERLLKGWTHAGIAVDLGLSDGTVKTYRDRAFERLGVRHRNELYALALSQLRS